MIRSVNIETQCRCFSLDLNRAAPGLHRRKKRGVHITQSDEFMENIIR